MVTADQINRFQLSIDDLGAAVNRRRSKLTKRLYALIALLGIGLLWYLTLELPDRARRARAVDAVTQQHGRIGGLGPLLPIWPFGKEYRITFSQTNFSPDDLQKLAVLNDLAGRHWVGVLFLDTNLKPHDLPRVQTVLPKCRVFIESSTEKLDRTAKDAQP